MNLFEKAKRNINTKTQCPYCKTYFEPDKRNVNRGWGIFCSKSCSVSFRNKLSRLSPSERTVEIRNKKLTQLGI